MQAQILLLIINALFICEAAKSKYNDEENDNPYEFGFTIDGQQHRHEKKDANGIIQGEFGFITADGVYHVTVYATDENGNFKILSMKNIKISGPLDEPGAKLPDTSQFSQGAPVQKVQPVATPPPPKASPNPLSLTTAKVETRFTTQPTIKPACAGCGYVTHRPNGPKLPFQTQAFNNPKPGSVVIGKVEEKKEFTSPPLLHTPTPPPPQLINRNNFDENLPPTSIDNQNLNYNNNNPPQTALVNLNVNNPQSPVSPNNNYPTDLSNVFNNNPPHLNPEQNYSPVIPNIPQPNPPEIISNVYPQTPGNSNNPKPNPPGLTNTNALDISQPLELSIPPSTSGITVENGIINVPNNPPIKIQDKYPNMVDGLPAGISKDDITDLLYKFNYTVGFHGHYEKGYKNGAKVGGYFVNDRDGVSRVVTYVADENGYRPKVSFIRLDLNSDLVPKEGTEKTFGLKNFEFTWYPLN